MLQGLRLDLRDGFRSLRRHAGVSLFACAMLALAIGANSTLFSLLITLMRPPGFTDPQRVVRLYPSDSEGRPWGAFSNPQLRDMRARTRTLSHLAAEAPRVFSLGSDEGNRRIMGAMVSGDYFGLLGRAPLAGRLLTPADDDLARPSRVVVISEGLWTRRFARSPDAVGRHLTLNGHDCTIVGVAPAGFRGTMPIVDPQCYVPIAAVASIDAAYDDATHRGGHSLIAYGRLAPGASRERAAADLQRIADELARTYPASDSGVRMTVLPELEGRIWPQLRLPVLGFFGLLFVVLGLLLLVACANVAGLLLARGEARRREIAVRVAIGATRARIVRQLLVEGAMLGVGASAAGFLLAHGLAKLLAGFAPPMPVPVTLDITPDGRVLGFAMLLGAVTSVGFSLAPALQAVRRDVLSGLQESAAPSTRRTRLRSALVVGQIAVTCALLASAGLLLRGMARAQHLDPGFDAERTAMVSIDLNLSGYTRATSAAFIDRVVERVRRRPGVEAVAIMDYMPLGLGSTRRGFAIAGEPPRDRGDREVGLQQVGPGYFRTAGLALLRGREFTAADRDSAPLVAVVNTEFARRHWPNGDALGRRITWDIEGGEPWVTVVGIAATSRYGTLGEPPQPFVYSPYAQGYENQVTILARSRAPTAGLAAQLAEDVRSIDRRALTYDVKSMREHLGIGLLPARLATWTLSAVGAMGLLLAGVGLFGLIAYSVSQRTREFGLRMALGATREDIVRLVLGQGGRLVLWGLGAGLVCAFALSQLVRGLLYGVSPADPMTFVATTLVLGVVAITACALPAVRASRTQPAVALRHE